MNIARNCTVFSVYCTKALFGSSELFKPDKATKFWIDFNYSSKSVSLFCQLNQSEANQPEFYVKIKIDKLQIVNQCDCLISATEPAIFSNNVSSSLTNARVAVFTLPEEEVCRLKKNHDLIDYYNTLSYSQSSLPASTPATIDQYLAECSPESQILPNSEKYQDLPKMKQALVKLRKIDAVIKESNDLDKYQSFAGFSLPIANSTLLSCVEDVPNRIESNEGSILDTHVSTVFKRPFAADSLKLQQTKKAMKSVLKSKKLPEPKVVEKTKNETKKPAANNDKVNKSCSYKALEEEVMSVEENPLQQNIQKTLPLSHDDEQQVTSTSYINLRKRKTATKKLKNSNLHSLSCDGVQNNSRRFFKTILLPPATHESKAQKKTIPKKASKIVEKTKNANLIRTGLRFQTASELNESKQITKEAEPVFNEKPKNYVLESIQQEATNDVEQSFLPKSTAKRRPRNRKKCKKDIGLNFVPYSKWKIIQNDKRPQENRKLTSEIEPPRSPPSLEHFDHLRQDGFQNKSFSNRPESPPCSSSLSSNSNHNFFINESDNEEERAATESVLVGNEEKNLLLKKTETVEQIQDWLLRPVVFSAEAAYETVRRMQMSINSDNFNTSASPVYENLDIDLVEPSPLDANQPITGDEQFEENTSPASNNLLEENQERITLQVSQHSIESNPPKPESSNDMNTPSKDISDIPTNLQFVEEFLEQLTQEKPTSSKGSPFSVYSTSAIEQEPSSLALERNVTNQVFIQNHYILPPSRKRIHPAEDGKASLAKMTVLQKSAPLKGWSQLLPNYFKDLTNKKNIVLTEVETKLKEDSFNNFIEKIKPIAKLITNHKTAIEELQEKMLSILKELEWNQKCLEQHQTELEKVHSEFMECTQTSLEKKETIEKIYKEAQDNLKTCADALRKDHWQSFSKDIIDSLTNRLSGLSNI